MTLLEHTIQIIVIAKYPKYPSITDSWVTELYNMEITVTMDVLQPRILLLRKT